MDSVVKLIKLHPSATTPVYKTSGASGADLTSIEDVFIAPGKYSLVRTGLSVELPPGLEMQIRPRSGLAFKHGVTVLNSPGTIDSDYRGEIGVILINHGEQEFHVEVGDRIAQAILSWSHQNPYIETNLLSRTERQNAGFGSTGRS
jgi:dUTP pyrophosphatase